MKKKAKKKSGKKPSAAQLEARENFKRMVADRAAKKKGNI